MFKKSIISIFVVILVAASFACPAFGAGGQSTVTIPAFTVTLNELKYDNFDYERYPLLVYKDITYFPMTYYQSNLLNLNTSWTAEGGLVIMKADPEKPKVFSYEAPVGNRNSKNQTATIIDSKVTVNGKGIDNKNEPYPLLSFRDVTYFPLTWRFAVEEFGWSYSFDNSTGLTIRADNCFYTANGDSYSGNASGEPGRFISVFNETHYIKGGLRISVNTETNRMGPIGGNLLILNHGREIRPVGYFGYYQKDGPLFTVDGDYIYTTYYMDFDEFTGRIPQPCKVDMETGEVQ